MRILGELGLQAAFVAAGYAAFASLLAGRAGFEQLARRGVQAAVVCLAALLTTLAVLGHALLVKDFSFEYVAHYTSQSLPWQYRLSALWVGQAGSLLLWTFFSAALAMLFFATSPSCELRRPAFGLLMANVAFLLAVMVFAADPMKAALTPRREGLGLSPLLQHPSMLIHPPVVFLAYAAWSVPFAVAAAALLSGKLDSQWLRQARPWALMGWVVLGAGLLLGAHWAYQELGWGGYWGWDPVENGSLIPWLTGTALIHSMMAWRHRGGLKKLAVSLAILTFALCNFATFLTRSGIFSSVHAFSESPIGWMFLGLMSVLLIAGGWLIWRRRETLAPEKPLGGPLARESLVLVSSYLLLLLTAVVTVGTLIIPLSTMLLGRTAQIGPEFYNLVLMPIGLAVLAATSAVPLLRWGGSPRPEQRRMFFLGCGLAVLAVAGGAALGLRHPVSLAVTGLAVLTVFSTLACWLLESRPSPSGLWLTLRQRRRQYAGYAVHLGLVCLAIGITGSSLGQQRRDVELREGEVLEWSGRRIEYLRLVQRETADKLIAEVELRVSRGGGSPVVLRPARHLHLLQNEWTTEVAIASSWRGDFYTILNAGLGEGRVHLTLVDNPLMRWLWLGGWVCGGATLVAAWPARRRRKQVNQQAQTPAHRRDSEPQPVKQRRAAA